MAIIPEIGTDLDPTDPATRAKVDATMLKHLRTIAGRQGAILGILIALLCVVAVSTCASFVGSMTGQVTNEILRTPRPGR